MTLFELSEANARLQSGGTAGPLARRTADRTESVWSDGITVDDILRCGANHTHARSNRAALGETISAPASAAGGTPDDEVGTLAGYTPLADGVTVDVAARTASEDEVGPSTYIDAVYPMSVHRGLQRELLGAAVYKAGSRTGVTSGRIIGTGASVAITTRPDTTVRLDDVLFATLPVDRDDSGAAVYTDDQLVGVVTSALDDLAIICHSAAIEDALGVELLPR